jgi:hypothetical protein
MWPLGTWGGAVRRIPVSSPVNSAGEWLGRLQGLQGTDLGAYLRRKQCRRAGTSEAGGGGRWRCYSGELAAWPGQQAKGEATGDYREGRGSTYWR